MSKIDEIIRGIDEAVEKFGNKTPGLERRLMELLDNATRELEVKNGRILSNVNNLKHINTLRLRLEKLVLNNDYLKQVKEFTQAFDRVAEVQKEYFAEFNKRYTPAQTASVIRQMAMDSTIDSLTESGVAANVTRPIMDMLKTSVISGGSYADLTKKLRESLISNQGKQSILDRHLKTVTMDALNQFSGQHLKVMSDDIGLEWYRYVGGSKTTSREFCAHLVKKEWIHESELPEVIKGNINGHQCKIYEKTGLPLGLIGGTTPSNFIVNRGGYNCGHKLIPIAKEAVPKGIRIKFDRKKAAKSIIKDVDKNIFSEIEVNGLKSKRATYKVKGYELIYNKNTINEFLSKYKDADDYYQRIEMLGDMEAVVKTAKYSHSEEPKHHKNSIDSFEVFEVEYKGSKYQLQCKKNSAGLFIYYIK